MRRLFLLLIPVLVLITVALAASIGNALTQSGWEDELQKYYLQRRSFGTIQAVTRASRPGNFSKALSRITYGSGPYSTDYSFQDKTFVAANIPYPPDEVWCVLLKNSNRSTANSVTAASYTVIFINYHLSLWFGGWVVHEGETSPFSPEFIRRVDALGCEPLKLPQLPSAANP
ncbi:MAG: hypothetical protein FOGNACKC_00478 [Anaerolineae bacterium]|nr:hypothetical protein [Anaerolineae bacterium]